MSSNEARRDKSEAEFFGAVAAMGGRPAPGALYVNSKTPVDLICAAGHPCRPTPSNTKKGIGICRTCAGNDPAVGEANFWQRVDSAGARPAPGAVYAGANVPVDLVCAAGHPCRPTPANIRRGQGLCRTCACKDPVVAEASFWERVAQAGAKPAPGATYVNGHTPVDLICAEGHKCRPHPASVQQGGGVCRACARSDPKVAEAEFWALVAERGATPAPAAVYAGGGVPVDLICENGHPCRPRPGNVKVGQGICRVCAGQDPATAEAEFWELVADLGAIRLPNSVYAGTSTPVELICPNGHSCRPRPAAIKGGQGLCKQCHVEFDRLYLLHHPEAACIKVGIASGTARVRRHEGRGYRLVHEWTGLDHDKAISLELAVLAWWRSLGWQPVSDAPMDGRSETTGSERLSVTHEWLSDALGARPDPESLASRPGRTVDR